MPFLWAHSHTCTYGKRNWFYMAWAFLLNLRNLVWTDYPSRSHSSLSLSVSFSLLLFLFFFNCPNFSSILWLLRSILKYIFFVWVCVCVTVSLQKSLVSFYCLLKWYLCVCVCDFYYCLVDPLCVTRSHGHIMTIHFILLLFLPSFCSFTQNNFQTISSSNNYNNFKKSYVVKKFPRTVPCVCLCVYDKIDHIDNDFYLMTSLKISKTTTTTSTKLTLWIAFRTL